GELIQGFVLLPDPGSTTHPAHRFGDQMIDVRLETGNAVRFSQQSLVWVWGTLHMLPGDPVGHTPLYVLKHARATPANKTDIQKYFKRVSRAAIHRLRGTPQSHSKRLFTITPSPLPAT